LLGLESSGETTPRAAHRAAHDRFLVVRGQGVRAVLPADEVWGIQHFHSRELKDVPTTVRKADSSHSKAVVSWRDHVVAVLDERLLFRTLQRSLG
jgi:chemotaxis signal transduction protein